MSLFFLGILLFSPEPAPSQPEPAFELPAGVVLFDETVRIAVSGLPAGRVVTVRLEQHDTAGLWRSHATLVADDAVRSGARLVAGLFGSQDPLARGDPTSPLRRMHGGAGVLHRPVPVSGWADARRGDSVWTGQDWLTITNDGMVKS